MKKFSQGNEEAVILEYFSGRPQGRVLDIGAYDGRALSNVAALLDLGWSGTLVEASSFVFQKLYANYENRSDVELVNAAIGMEWGLSRWWDSMGDAVSTTELRNFAIYKSVLGRPVTVPTVPVSELLARFPGPYDFVSIDTEGTSVELFKSIDFDVLGASLICVEHDGDSGQVGAIADAQYGMRMLYCDANNIIMGK